MSKFILQLNVSVRVFLPLLPGPVTVKHKLSYSTKWHPDALNSVTVFKEKIKYHSITITVSFDELTKLMTASSIVKLDKN